MSNQLVSLSEYLKKYSTISSSFIDDFYALYNYNTNDDDFVINLEILAKWLKAEKKHLKELKLWLIKYFSKPKKTKKRL